MKKKLFAAAMAGTMVLSLAACGGSKPAETTAAPAAVDKTEAAAEGETKAEVAAEGVANVDMMPYYLNAEDSAKNDEQIYNTIKEIADSLEQ